MREVESGSATRQTTYTEDVATTTAERPFRREIELDFVRGIAILLVVDFHEAQYGLLNYVLRPLHIRPFGWMGVDIFFVLSGFLVGGLLVKEWKVKGRIDSKSFLIRRGFKIWPQYYVYLLLLIATGHRSVRELWGNLLNIQNYVGGVAHTWSLAVEEHAYLLIILFLALAARWQARMRTLFLFFAGLSGCIVLLRLYLSSSGVNVFDPTHTRVSAIFYGVMLAILYHYAPETFHRMQGWWWLWIGILAATLVYLRFHFVTWWDPATSIDLADFSGIALLMLLYRHREGKKHNWLYRAVAWIGLYSYGIYLWHVSVDAPINAVAKRIPSWLVAPWEGVAPMLMGILIGVVTTKLVEFPALRLRERWFPRRVDSAVGTPAELEPQEAEAKA
jgi:peptidoglycan/LPS O-acetylase OafA/YrhL